MKINQVIKESNSNIDPRATSQRIRAIQAELKTPLSSDQRGALRAELEKLVGDMQTWQSSMPVKEDARTDQLEMIVRNAIAGNLEQWNQLTRKEQFRALEAAGLMSFSDRMTSDVHPEKFNPAQILAQARMSHQDQEYQIEIGPEKRAELKAKADELAEIRRRQLQKEKLEKERLAYERYKDDADRAAAMKKIEMEYKHDLDMLNTEHRNNMEAIRTGNAHEINKMNMDYAEAARERAHELEREKMRQQQQQQAQRERPQRTPPEPEDTDDEEEPGEPFRPQAPAGPGLAAPAKPPKPSRYDTSDATDVDYTETPRPPKPGKPPQLPGIANEEIERLKQLAGR